MFNMHLNLTWANSSLGFDPKPLSVFLISINSNSISLVHLLKTFGAILSHEFTLILHNVGSVFKLNLELVYFLSN